MDRERSSFSPDGGGRSWHTRRFGATLSITERAKTPEPGRVSRSTRGPNWWVVAAAAVPSALYLLYVYHYAVNIPFIDDWQVMPVVAAAIHGHIAFGSLWQQWTDSRAVVYRLVCIVFALVDRLDERAVILFSAAIFVGTYFLVLLLYRSYRARPLAPPAVLVIGVVWFSLVDWEQVLWSSTESNYLVVFFLMLAVYLLLVPDNYRQLCFGLSVASGVLASLSFVEGFLVWPVGLTCLLWSSARKRTELDVWVATGIATAAYYFHGYNFVNYGCASTQDGCSIAYSLSHRGELAQYFVLLVGNVIPQSGTGLESHLWAHQVQGAVLLGVAVLVVVQTLRERRAQPNPLPLLLIVFGLLYDAVIADGRFGSGLPNAVAPGAGRYSMPNVIVLVAIVMFAFAHVRRPHFAPRLVLAGFGALMALVAFQCIVGTAEGITDGRGFHQNLETSARIVVNLDEVPLAEKACYVARAETANWFPLVAPWYWVAERDHLTVFSSTNALRRYRSEGPPVLPECAPKPVAAAVGLASPSGTKRPTLAAS